MRASAAVPISVLAGVVLVDPAGAVTFSKATLPPDRYPCEGYPQLAPTVTP
jgi:hypothetical protein